MAKLYRVECRWAQRDENGQLVVHPANSELELSEDELAQLGARAVPVAAEAVVEVPKFEFRTTLAVPAEPLDDNILDALVAAEKRDWYGIDSDSDEEE